MNIITKIEMSLYAAAGMLWEILWALILGFILSAIVMTFIPKTKVASGLGGSGLKEVSFATFLGAISSSCSYAAAAMGRSLFEGGASIAASLAFMLASTNLVIELSAAIWSLMGWPFVVGEFLGGILLVLISSLLINFCPALKTLKRNTPSEVENQDPEDFKTWHGWQVVGQNFIGEGRMIASDILLGVLIAGFLMEFVPDSFWQGLFLASSRQGFFQVVENAFVGPIVSMLSFVCSVGNIPLASVLYHGGISFGGALSFIYADLIIIPLLLIYRKYYGWRAAAWIGGIFYISMVITGILVECFFQFLNLIPPHPVGGSMIDSHFFQWNSTTWLNLVFLLIGLFLFYGAKTATPKSESCCH